MSDWAKTLLAETIEEIWDGDVEMTFAQRDKVLAVLERRLLGLLEAGAKCAHLLSGDHPEDKDYNCEKCFAVKAHAAAKAVASEAKRDEIA